MVNRFPVVRGFSLVRDGMHDLEGSYYVHEIAAAAELPRKDVVLDCFVSDAPRKDVLTLP